MVSFGFVALAGSVAWLSAVVAPGATQATFIAPMILFGLGTGCVFSPLANLATSGLDGRTAGAGAGAFNTTRQVGGVIGSAAIVAILTSRLSIALPAAASDAATHLPEGVRDQFIKGFGSADLSSGALSGDATAFPLPPGTPADVAAQLRDAATTAFHSGFSTAVGQTLIAAVAVVVIGLVAALFMRPTAPAGARTSAPLPANSQEAH